MNNKIQGIITTIYDWLETNPAIKMINHKASYFCSDDDFLRSRQELNSTISKITKLMNEFSERVDEITVCLRELHNHIDRKVSKSQISTEELNILIEDKIIIETTKQKAGCYDK